VLIIIDTVYFHQNIILEVGDLSLKPFSESRQQGLLNNSERHFDIYTRTVQLML